MDDFPAVPVLTIIIIGGGRLLDNPAAVKSGSGSDGLAPMGSIVPAVRSLAIAGSSAVHFPSSIVAVWPWISILTMAVYPFGLSCMCMIP
jgi:hypothetical protein